MVSVLFDDIMTDFGKEEFDLEARKSSIASKLQK